MSEWLIWTGAIVGIVGGLTGIASFGFNWNRGRRRLRVSAEHDYRLNHEELVFEVHNHGARQEVIVGVGLHDRRRRKLFPADHLSVPQDTTAFFPVSTDVFAGTWHDRTLGSRARAIVTTAAGGSYSARVRRDVLTDPFHPAFLEAKRRQQRRPWYRRWPRRVP